jgi:hypothetical protein
MLLTKAVMDGIIAGNITLVFRRWQKPTVKAGGTLKNGWGQLAIGSVSIVDPATISAADARAAGWDTPAELVEDLFRERSASKSSGRGARSGGDRDVYRIEVSYLGIDTRVALRNDDNLSDEDLQRIVEQLDGFDRRSSFGPWTRSALTLIETWPGRRAPELAEMVHRETLSFKGDVRKLKTLGLTESLTVGYQLSPRGTKVLRHIRA